MIMFQPLCSLFLLSIIIATDCTTRISYINSAAYIPPNFSSALLYNGTCSECICFAITLNNSGIYKALNCYVNNKTCLLFTNFLSQSYIKIDTNSRLFFLPLSTDTTTGMTTTTTTVSCTIVGDQCGGSTWSGLTNCCAGLSCMYNNASYSQCLPTLITSTSTYWDCCKLSCGWPGKASVTSPARTCQQDGVNAAIISKPDSCTNSGSGAAYMCINQQPWNVSSNLSYGFAGAGLIGQNESYWCCACYSIVFTSAPVIGKEMIVQVINTAYSPNNMFVLQIPGSGWGGSSASGCPNQFNGSYSWGNQNGGISQRSDCYNLPSALLSGCLWRFDWFMNASNPIANFRQVACPSPLTSISGCVRY